MAMEIMCSCGAKLTILKSLGSREDVPVVQQCSACIIAGYEAGYTDGAATADHKTTLTAIMAATAQETV
jgi:hypothetical protein